MKSTTYQIRPATAADRAQWDPVTDLLWQRILDPAHEIECRLAAAADASLAGLVHYFPHAHTWYANPVCYLNDLFVLPGIRGGGIGKLLIEAVADEAKQRGWSEVYWHTQQHNTVARGLYDKLTGGTDGFVNRRHRRLRQLHHRSNRSGNLSFDESRALMNQAGKLFFSPGHATAK
jgi:GNAT superfamily N-acetyltransferase